VDYNEYPLAGTKEFERICVGLCEWCGSIFYEEIFIFSFMESQGEATVHNGK
jgi:hypothetical protein